jgi:methylornithine synthase
VDKILSTPQVSEIAQRALAGAPPTHAEIVSLLELDRSDAAEALFEGARCARRKSCGDKIFLYGFLYLSTYCRNDCAFCHFRTSRKSLSRYRKSPSEIFEAAQALAASGVHLIDLTMGEDERYLTGEGFEALCQVVADIKNHTSLPVMLSPGLLEAWQPARLKKAGVDWYAVYQETHNRDLFADWRRGQDFDQRLSAKKIAIDEGLLVEDGVLVGAGASRKDLADSIIAMGRLGARQVRAMGYRPPPGGMPHDRSVDANWQELLMIAVMRLTYPTSLIPASLDVEGLAGLGPRLMAGANVVTSLIPASQGLAGVASVALDIENNNRSAPTVAEHLPNYGLRAATAEESRVVIDSEGALDYDL